MVATKGFKYPDQELYDWVLNELHKRNINNHTVGEIAYEMQHQYLPHLTVEDFGAQLDEVLKKREVLNILATGFALDNLANEGLLPEPLQTIVKEDAGVYGVDETISLALSQLYGSIAVTNYGYEDKKKLGIAAKLDNSNGQVNTFADDLALALASAVIGRCGHGSKLELEKSSKDTINAEDIPAKDILTDVSSMDKTTIGSYGEFINTLNELANNALEEKLQEEFHYDYYVNFALNIKKHDGYLYVKCFNNNLEHEDTISIYLPDLYAYCYVHNKELFTKKGVVYSTLAHAIAGFIFENDLYVYPKNNEDEDKTKNGHETKEEAGDPIQESIKKIFEEMISVITQVAGKQELEVDPFEELFKTFFGKTGPDNDKKEENNAHE